MSEDPLPLATPVPCIRIRPESSHLWVCPAGSDPAGQFPCFDLPVLLPNLLEEFQLFASEFWHKYRRCCAGVLLLNHHLNAWGCMIPTQRCAADSVSWTIKPEQMVGLPAGTLLAGSIQSRYLTAGDDPTEAVPPHDGYHVILNMRFDPSLWVIYLRMGGDLEPMAPSQVIAQARQFNLETYLPRMQLV